MVEALRGVTLDLPPEPEVGTVEEKRTDVRAGAAAPRVGRRERSQPQYAPPPPPPAPPDAGLPEGAPDMPPPTDTIETPPPPAQENP